MSKDLQTVHKDEALTLEAKAFELFLVKWNLMKHHTPLRLGQYFHQHFGLEKSVAHKNKFDKLYQLDGQVALKYIRDIFIFS